MAKATAAPPKKNTKPTHPLIALHPPYFAMISEAIATLKDRTGSSQPAIAKFIEDKYKDAMPQNFKKMLSIQLKKFVKCEKLIKVKNSYKLSSTEKLKLAIEEDQKARGSSSNAKKALNPRGKAAKKITEKGGKTKRLSQVRTPEGLKKARKKDVNRTTMKRLSHVKTPDELKRNKNLTTVKRKNLKGATTQKKTKK